MMKQQEDHKNDEIMEKLKKVLKDNFYTKQYENYEKFIENEENSDV